MPVMSQPHSGVLFPVVREFKAWSATALTVVKWRTHQASQSSTDSPHQQGGRCPWEGTGNKKTLMTDVDETGDPRNEYLRRG